jgi:hypothetical protein
MKKIEQMMYYLRAQISATTVVTGKSRKCFFCPKNPIFMSFQTKKTSLTTLKQLQTNPSIQKTQKISKNLKSN